MLYWVRELLGHEQAVNTVSCMGLSWEIYWSLVELPARSVVLFKDLPCKACVDSSQAVNCLYGIGPAYI